MSLYHLFRLFYCCVLIFFLDLPQHMKRILYFLIFFLLWMAVPGAASIETDSFEPLMEEECEFIQTESLQDLPAEASARPHRNRIRPILPEVPSPAVSSRMTDPSRYSFAGRFSSLQRTYIGKRYLYCVYRV